MKGKETKKIKLIFYDDNKVDMKLFHAVLTGIDDAVKKRIRNAIVEIVGGINENKDESLEVVLEITKEV